MKKYVVVLLFSVFGVAAVQAQYHAASKEYKAYYFDNQVNFYDVCKKANEYFHTIDTTAKGSGWKGFMRWKHLNEYKYYPSGDRSIVDPAFAQKQYQLFLQQNNAADDLFPNGWKDLGPYTIDSLTGHYAAGLGRVEDVYVDPNNANRIYQASRSGGFWKSLDGGQTWQGGSTDFLAASGVNTMSVSPTNPDSILINLRNALNGYSYGLYRSTDGGDSWLPSNFNPGNLGFGGLGSNFVIFQVAYHPRIPNLIFVGTNRGLFKSEDNLATWTQSMTSSDVSQIAFHPTNDSIVYIYDDYFFSVNPNTIFRSTDLGNSFSYSNNFPGNGGDRSIRLSTSPVCPNCLWVASNNGIWKSLDNGISFEFIANPDESCRGFAISDADTSKMIYGYVDLQSRLTGIDTFAKVTRWSLGNTNGAGNGHHNSYINSSNYVHADLRIAKSVNGVFYVGTDGFVSKSSDNGVTWENIGEGVGIRENYALGASQSNHYRTTCGSQDNGTSILMEYGWNEFYGADGMEGIIHPLNDDWMLTSLQNGGRRVTRDGGQNQSGATPDNSNSGYWIAPLAFDPNDPFHTYDFRDIVYKSETFGTDYIGLGSPTTFNGTIQQAAIAENNSDIIVIAQGNRIEKSFNGGISFGNIQRANLPSGSIQDIAFDPNDDETIIIVYASHSNDNQKVFITTNGGTTWANITANLGSMPIRSVVIDHTPQSNIYLGAEVGVYTKPMNATNWSLYNTNLPNMTVRELEVVWGSNTIRAATWGRGLWEYHLVDRADFPAILTTEITNPPTLESPKEGLDQWITSEISYDGNLNEVYVRWSKDVPTYNNIIPMLNTSDSTWRSISPIPSDEDSVKIFFKVYAIGDNNDTSETYKFIYDIHPFEYCYAQGNTSQGNLYLSNIELNGFSNSSLNDSIIFYDQSFIELFKDSTYTLNTTANTGWGWNDHYAWIDFNNDAIFSDDELLINAIDTGQFVSQTFQIPNWAAFGDTVRMRIRLGYYQNNANPCGNFFGEVEEYSVVLKTVCQPIETIHEVEACMDFTWIDGNTYFANTNSPVVVLKNNFNCDSTVRLNLTIVPDLNANISNNNGTLLASPNSSNYQWLDCDNLFQPISGAIAANYSPIGNGSFAVVVSSNNCQDTSECFDFMISSAGVLESYINDWMIYPNPNDGLFIISSLNNESISRFSITDVSGKIITDKMLLTSRPQIELNLSSVSKGLYFVRIEGVKSTKVIPVRID